MNRIFQDTVNVLLTDINNHFLLISTTSKNFKGLKSKHFLFSIQYYKRCEVKVTGTVIMKKCSLIVSSVPFEEFLLYRLKRDLSPVLVKARKIECIVKTLVARNRKRNHSLLFE